MRKDVFLLCAGRRTTLSGSHDIACPPQEASNIGTGSFHAIVLSPHQLENSPCPTEQTRCRRCPERHCEVSPGTASPGGATEAFGTSCDTPVKCVCFILLMCRLKDLIQPVKEHLCHQAAVFHRAVICRTVIARNDDQLFYTLWNVSRVPARVNIPRFPPHYTG